VDELREKTSDGLEIVGRIVRNTDQELIVREGVYKGIPIVDLRWYVNDKPSIKGVRVNKEEMKVLVGILMKVENDESE
jgi:hypothetical protein|tara:strand:- start:286 stop:519 length:234 start_codon:yes stop_codon:yes gene_type:complete